jgi:hypothetical protein
MLPSSGNESHITVFSPFRTEFDDTNAIRVYSPAVAEAIAGEYERTASDDMERSPHPLFDTGAP